MLEGKLSFRKKKVSPPNLPFKENRKRLRCAQAGKLDKAYLPMIE